MTWLAPVNNGGSAITGYQILWDAGTGGSMQSYTGTYSGSTSLIVTTGITAGLTYNFKVAATNIVGTSTFGLIQILAGTPGPLNAPTTIYNQTTNKI